MTEHADHPQAAKLTESIGGLSSEAIVMLMQHPVGTPKGDALREQMLRQELYGIKAVTK